MNGERRMSPGDLLWLARTGGDEEIAVRDGGGALTTYSVSGDAARALESHDRPAEDVELRLIAPDGSSRSVVARAVPGVPGLAVAIDAAGADRRLAPVVETLVNQIAHDVRNYAFTVGLQAELGDRRSEAPEVKGHFAAVLRQVDALKGYLDHLLLYGRPVALRPAAIDPGALLLQQVKALQLAWRRDAGPPAVEVVVADDVGQVRWDPVAMGHALRALLDNAVRSAEPAPPVAARVTRNGARVVVEITDRGAGIPAETLPLLGAPMRVRRHGGAGLGLAISRKLVAAHGGTLELTSGPGGTTVRLEIPREVQPG